MLKRLEDKGFVSAANRSAAFSTAPSVSDTVAKKSALSEIVRVFFNGSPASAASALLGMSDRLKEDELDELEADDRPRAEGQRGPSNARPHRNCAQVAADRRARRSACSR